MDYKAILDFGSDPVTSVEEKISILKFSYDWACVVEEEERKNEETKTKSRCKAQKLEKRRSKRSTKRRRKGGDSKLRLGDDHGPSVFLKNEENAYEPIGETREPPNKGCFGDNLVPRAPEKGDERNRNDSEHSGGVKNEINLERTRKPPNGQRSDILDVLRKDGPEMLRISMEGPPKVENGETASDNADVRTVTVIETDVVEPKVKNGGIAERFEPIADIALESSEQLKKEEERRAFTFAKNEEIEEGLDDEGFDEDGDDDDDGFMPRRLFFFSITGFKN